jgi:hypothetical protein
MKKKVIEKCWENIKPFYEMYSHFSYYREPTWEEKTKYAEFETYGKNKELFNKRDGFIDEDIYYLITWAKKWRTIHINTWINDLTHGKYEKIKKLGETKYLLSSKGNLFYWNELPEQFYKEVKKAVTQILG